MCVYSGNLEELLFWSGAPSFLFFLITNPITWCTGQWLLAINLLPPSSRPCLSAAMVKEEDWQLKETFPSLLLLILPLHVTRAFIKRFCCCCHHHHNSSLAQTTKKKCASVFLLLLLLLCLWWSCVCHPSGLTAASCLPACLPQTIFEEPCPPLLLLYYLFAEETSYGMRTALHSPRYIRRPVAHTIRLYITVQLAVCDVYT